MAHKHPGNHEDGLTVMADGGISTAPSVDLNGHHRPVGFSGIVDSIWRVLSHLQRIGGGHLSGTKEERNGFPNSKNHRPECQ